MARFGARMSVGALAVLLSGPAAAQGRAAAAPEQVPFVHMNAHTLSIHTPGVAAIRTRREWEQLWYYYGQEFGYGAKPGGRDSIATAPAVDFDRDMVVAVTLGARSGCGPHIELVNRILRTADTLQVVLGPDVAPRRRVTCAMVVSSVDFVRLPRDDRRHVVFTAARPDMEVPGAAPWWVHPSVEAAQDTAYAAPGRVVSRRVLPTDSSTTRDDLLRLARTLVRDADDELAWRLLGNPKVVSNPKLLYAIAIPMENRPPGIFAMNLLRDTFGMQLATDPATPPEVLSFLVHKLGDYGARLPLARQLFLRPSVRASQEDMQWLTGHGDSAFVAEVCRDYVTRFPEEMHWRDNTGKIIGTRSAGCQAWRR